ncbi:hypothetical protein Smp_192140 [Schistosoma mansoni]|uniref:hypothetical protein n=1 Tax=Schistosoma mansoni TaxID=6183 RepID=UPI00019B38FA|nr:hypothetical protein Smp_192140 [Schistosoma mansoni]|eukprot:XP_018652901.1 hypothetical protein Smp_192140 [Schistosoma mansoni]
MNSVLSDETFTASYRELKHFGQSVECGFHELRGHFEHIGPMMFTFVVNTLTGNINVCNSLLSSDRRISPVIRGGLNTPGVNWHTKRSDYVSTKLSTEGCELLDEAIFNTIDKRDRQDIKMGCINRPLAAASALDAHLNQVFT